MSAVVLDLPVPPSINRTRKLDLRNLAKLNAWKSAADNLLLAQRYRVQTAERFELHITLSEAHTKADMDNVLKNLIDYLRRIEAIRDDSPRHLRKLTIEWGSAPEGVRVIVMPLDT